MDTLSALLKIGGPIAEAALPLLMEIEQMIANASKAKAEQHDAIVSEFEAATAALIQARAQSATDHAALTAETERIIAEEAKKQQP